MSALLNTLGPGLVVPDTGDGDLTLTLCLALAVQALIVADPIPIPVPVPSRSLSRSPDRHRHKNKKDKRRRSRSRSPSRSDERSRHKKKKHRTHEEKERRRREKKEKKKKKHTTGSSSARWGKYGIISEADFYNKTQEFRTWLLEERKLNPEALSKDQERKEFQVFVEDYNTGMLIVVDATLPHEKYYHIEAYERRMAALRAGEFVPPPDDGYDPTADMKAHATKHKKPSAEQESYLSREQLLELRRVQNERIEIGRMKRLGMDIKQNMGVRMDGTLFDD
ncbi:hypothetical protein EDC04DRAFT_2906339 [Pisolithus marmoratus]|nr:hypothetical protein EDC04DRAFT_2906339 [Pisolithus marmoratus]